VYKKLTGLDGPEEDALVTRNVETKGLGNHGAGGAAGAGAANASSSVEVEEYADVPTPRCWEVDAAAPGAAAAPPVTVNAAVYEACCAVLERLLRPQDEDYLDQVGVPPEPYLTSHSFPGLCFVLAVSDVSLASRPHPSSPLTHMKPVPSSPPLGPPPPPPPPPWQPLPADHYGSVHDSHAATYPPSSAGGGGGYASGANAVMVTPLEWELIGSHDVFAPR
jgi:hypothetical protein